MGYLQDIRKAVSHKELDLVNIQVKGLETTHKEVSRKAEDLEDMVEIRKTARPMEEATEAMEAMAMETVSVVHPSEDPVNLLDQMVCTEEVPALAY